MTGRIVGFISNRPELGAQVLRSYASDLDVTADEPVGWGVGFYQSGELLLRRRPVDDRRVIPVAALAEDMGTGLLMGHVGRPQNAELRTENTQPFRYRQWLFAQAGCIEGFAQARPEIADTLPDFLRRNLRGQSDGEVLFYALLAELHAKDQLHISAISEEQLRAGLRRFADGLAAMLAQHQLPNAPIDLFLTDGESWGVLHQSGTLAQRVVAGRHEVETFLGDELGASSRATSADKARCVVIASALQDPPADWQRLPHPAVISLSRVGEPTVETL
ncbi:MAG TPA: class II glutamine amidotransferase [Polyangiaceae bacterium]|jgi:glutamine amidotransferase|nr:class II glutamine amidotransferase [Polyangiaceae bacterium]